MVEVGVRVEAVERRYSYGGCGQAQCWPLLEVWVGATEAQPMLGKEHKKGWLKVKVAVGGGRD